ncbi:senescence-associated carboxylesterase 101-like [Prosopis cineraria]|uniref:senescence-associated carboxylesterase 101-like n=1 Tax=Prosopis cineraria TaxID=364024 RepID=UPI00240FA3D0|nr:senescence-associated carboxylesterase 101-like [Prosopis cineraria]
MSKEVSEQGQTHHGKDYVDTLLAPLLDVAKLKFWSFYKALIAEFIATLLFLYVTIAIVIDHKKFSCGLELASFVASSDLLTSSCKLISDLDVETHSDQNLFCKKVSKESGLTIIVFRSTQNHVQSDLLLFSIDMDDNLFKFICSRTNPNFSLNRSVFSLFKKYRTQVGQLKSEENLVKELHKQEMLLIKKSQRFKPNKKLNDMKRNMAELGWYKKHTKNERNGYYESYKDGFFPRDQDAIMLIKVLNDYWEDMVQEAEKQPQKEGENFRTKWLYGGTNYRRMVEPLDIARYYKEGKRDYIKQGRSEHYKQLENRLECEPRRQPESISGTNIGSILTLDSCFWARVEKVVVLTQNLKVIGDQSSEAEKREAMNSLDEFEKHVYGSLKKYAVSPEIFLAGSSFVRWWE